MFICHNNSINTRVECMAGTCFLGQNTCLKKIQGSKYTNNPRKRIFKLVITWRIFVLAIFSRIALGPLKRYVRLPNICFGYTVYHVFWHPNRGSVQHRPPEDQNPLEVKQSLVIKHGGSQKRDMFWYPKRKDLPSNYNFSKGELLSLGIWTFHCVEKNMIL